MRIKPDFNLKKVYDIDTDLLKNRGIKVILFDLDSTLMISKSGKYLDETKQWLNNLKNDFKIAIISNNTNENYLNKVKAESDFDVIGHARKPSIDVAKSYLDNLGYAATDVALVGDRPLTDILCGKRLGCTTILVDSINAENENFPTRFVRWLERLTIKR